MTSSLESNQNKSTVEWFKHEVLNKRYVAIVGWSLFIQVCLIWAVKFLNIFFSRVLGFHHISTSTVLYCQFYVAILLIGLNVLYFRNAKVYPELPGSPLSSLFCFLQPQTWFHGFFFVTLGALWSHSLCLLLGGSSFQTFWEQKADCQEQSSGCCVNEHHFFVILHGAFVGLHFCLSYHIQHLYCLKFEVVQQLKLPSAKAKVREQVRKSVTAVIKNIRWFYLSYYFLGFIPKHFVTAVMGQTFCNSAPLTSLLGLLNFELLWTTCLVGISLHVSWSITLSFVHVFLTEPYSFPLEATFEKAQVRLLSNAMSDHSNELLQHLAFRNLSFVAQYSSSGRKKIFSISIPGGHPHTWNEISRRCLEIIEHFQLAIGQAVMTPSVTSHIKSTSVFKPNYSSTKTCLSASVEPIVKLDNVLDIKKWVMENVMNKSMVQYLTKEPSERKLEKLYCNCQLVIWSIQALCFLARASYSEDHHGVLQWSLPKIISTLLDLQIAVERSPKGLHRNNLSSYREFWSSSAKSLCLKQSLRSSINSGLYYISCTFKQHLKYINLTDDHQNRLERYLQMKE